MTDSLFHLSSAFAPPLFAGLGKYLPHLTTRAGIIQMCVICMCLALFIIMKKFADVPPRPFWGKPRVADHKPPAEKVAAAATDARSVGDL